MKSKKIHAEPSQDVQRELMKSQEKIIAMYRKRLTPKFQQELQKFAQSGKQIGSSEYFKLSPLVREIMYKLNMANLDILSKHAKNPLKKIQLWIARLATKKIAAATPKKKDPKKDAKQATVKATESPMKRLFGKK